MDTAILLTIPFWVLWAIGMVCWIIFMVKDHKHNKNDPGWYGYDYEGGYGQWRKDFDAWVLKRKRIRKWNYAFYAFLFAAIVFQFIRIIVTA